MNLGTRKGAVPQWDDPFHEVPMELQLGLILQIVTLFTLVLGVFFGLGELRRAHRARADKGALDVFNISIQPDHVNAIHMILDLPEDASAERVSGTADLRQVAHLIMNQFEFWGILVFQRIVPLRTLDLLVGGVVRVSWRRLTKYVEAQRIERNLPNLAEWFQWLAERLEEYQEPSKELGTHVAFKKWRP